MKNMKRAFALLLCLCMVLSYVPMHVHAESTTTNIGMELSATEVNVGDTFTITVYYDSMTVSSFGCPLSFDKDLVQFVSATACDPDYPDEFGLCTKRGFTSGKISTPEEANKIGQVGFVVAGTDDVAFKACDIYTATFRAKAAGTVTFTLREDSAGASGFKGVAATQTVTITGDSEPEHTCADANKDHVCDNGCDVAQGPACESNAQYPCVAGKCEYCDKEYAAAENHKDENPKDHVCDNGCDVAQGEHADGDDANHTCDYCGKVVDGETCTDADNDGDHKCDECGAENVTECTEGDPVETTNPASCTEEGSVTTETFCTECGAKLSSKTESIPAGTGCQLADPEYTWADDYSSCKAEVKCQHGTVHKKEEVTATSEVTTKADCQTAEVVTYTATFAADWAVEQTKIVTGEKNPDNHVGGVVFRPNDDGKTHNGYCGGCDAGLGNYVARPHDYTTGTADHTCICGAVEEFKLTIYALQFSGDDMETNCPLEISVPYGAKLKDHIPENCGEGYGYAPIYKVGDTVTVNGSWYDGTFTVIGWYEPNNWSDLNLETATMPASDYTMVQLSSFTGWCHEYWDVAADKWAETPLGTCYIQNGEQLTGWQQIDGSWYCFVYNEAQDSFYRAEGITRVPYPEEDSGLSYAPDADAMLSEENFIDANEAWFWFDENGVFQKDNTGFVPGEEVTRYAVKGMIPWHVGMVQDDKGDYYYFLGDEENGGNIMATGDIYVMRNNTDRDFFLGGIYTFSDEGVLCDYDGIEEVNGKLRYYEDDRLMAGNGLTKVGDNYIYVRYNGYLVVGAEYYVPANTLGVVEGMYTFDENGFLVNPELTTKDGIVAENGGLYFYKNGKIAYGAGLIEYNGKVIYVRSNGQLAVGEYYVTNVKNYTGSDLKYGDKLTFDDNGFMVTPKNGIVAENGTLYYYKNGKIAYGAGLIYLEDEGCYIYVRSNGQLATGIYWPTTTNGYDFSGRYDFGTDGKLYI